MFKLNTYVRSTGMVAGVIAAGLAVGGCSKSEEAGTAPTAPTPAPTIASSDIFTQPIERKMPEPSTVIAVVNGTEITLGQFNKEMETMMSRMQGRVPPERMGQMQMQMRDQLLDNLITRQVLLDTVESENIEVDAVEYDKAVADLSENLPPGMSLNDMLAQTGMAEDEFRKTLEMELKIRKLIESKTGGPSVATDEEILAFYTENEQQFTRDETVSASHILIGTEPNDTEESKAEKLKQIEDLRQQLIDGADFAALAGEHSSCPSRAQGGDLGQFERGRMVPQFEQAAFSQEVGTIGDVVETQFGYHLIKVTARNEPGVTPLEEVKEQLANYLNNQKQQRVVQEYVTTLKESADISFPGAPGQN